MSSNPYLLDLPAVVSFSGGRTSGFMLRHILDSHGGLPDEMEVCFENTGLEHQATYDFVEEVSRRWEIPITWLEYRVGEGDTHSYTVVTPETASRNGEPFTELINLRGYLPNVINRQCTANLKMRTLSRYLKAKPMFEDGYTIAVGLRYDEPRRALRLKGDTAREDPVAPMYYAKHTEEDVLEFWKNQPFDLELPLRGNMAGNCVGCFLKSRGKIEILMEEMPEHFEWWLNAEQSVSKTAEGRGAKFRKDWPSYAQMMKSVKEQGSLFPPDNEDTIPCMCTD
jgi:3'-phosphoadenosine 5'-phosphosulfate sulfotransferase (PAPS reductase)/FAD synthetase